MSDAAVVPADSPPPIAPQEAGLGASAVQRAVEFAIATGASQMIVLAHGGTVADVCTDAEPGAAADVFAIQKSIFAILFGMAQARGMIGLDESLSDLLGAGWSRLAPHQEREVLIRHVMTMTTGMSDQLDALGVLGETWRYNNVAYGLLKEGFCARMGMDLTTLTHAWLGERLGLRDTHWRDREARLPDGRPMTALFSSARDLARIGQAMLATAQARTTAPLVPADWWAACKAPGSNTNPAWGLLWWFNGRDRYMVPFSDRVFSGPIVPGAPADLFAARGAGDQRLLIVPSRSLVVVRLGVAVPKTAGAFDAAFMARLLDAAAPA